MAVLTVHNLGKYFGGQDIFSGLNLSVNQGDRIALVGPNGEGKTTLLQIITGTEPATAGHIQTAKALKIGYLEQHASLISSNVSLWDLALQAFVDLRRGAGFGAAGDDRVLRSGDRRLACQHTRRDVLHDDCRR